MAEFPSLPLFTDAIMADCQHLTNNEFGLYMRILMVMWRSPEGRIPAGAEWLEKRFKSPISEVGIILSEFCVTDGNWWSQKRLKKEMDWVRQNSKKQSVRAKSRWDKEKTISRGNATVCNAPHPTPPIPSKKDTTLLEGAIYPNAFRKIYDYGTELFPGLASRNTSEITKWAAAGVHPELDAIPELLRAKGRLIKSWSYFTGAIMDAKANRLKPLPEGKAHENFRSVSIDGNSGNRNQKPNKQQRLEAALSRGLADIADPSE